MKRRTLLGGAILFAMAGKGLAQEKKDARTEAIDPAPLDNELEKYPRCVICNMDRRKFHYARHLLHYADGHVQGTCSVHCVGECMLRERRRGFQAIYAPDFGATVEPKPLIEVSSATYLIGSDLRGVMTPVSKVSFASREAALQARLTYGGEIGNFGTAISASMEEAATGLVRRYGNDRERQRRMKAGAPAA
jgi:nitrous oxide reductase accessory protein NosL